MKRLAPVDAGLMESFLDQVHSVLGKLGEIRKEKRVTRKVIAEHMGCRPANVSHLLLGQREPTWRTMFLLADALDMEIEIRLKPKGELMNEVEQEVIRAAKSWAEMYASEVWKEHQQFFTDPEIELLLAVQKLAQPEVAQ